MSLENQNITQQSQTSKIVNSATQKQEEIKGLPDKIHELLHTLPEDIQKRILENQLGSDYCKSHLLSLPFEKEKISDEEIELIEKNLEVISPKERETKFIVCLQDLFYKACIAFVLKEQSSDKIYGETQRLMDIIWNNKNKEKIKIFNQQFFDDYIQKQRELIKVYMNTDFEIEEMKKSIQKTHSKKRLTEEKELQNKTLWEIRDLSEEEIKNHFHKNERKHSASSVGKFNFTIGRFLQDGLLDKQSKEESMTKILSKIVKYFDTLELSTMMSDFLRKNFGQKIEKSNLKPGEQYQGRGEPFSESEIEEQKKFVENLFKAIEDWNETHEKENNVTT